MMCVPLQVPVLANDNLPGLRWIMSSSARASLAAKSRLTVSTFAVFARLVIGRKLLSAS